MPLAPRARDARPTEPCPFPPPVSVEPYANGQPLLGNFKLGRNVSGNSIAILPDSISGWYRVVARSPGRVE